MKVWILTTGEKNEGGNIIGVYAHRELAFADFMEHGKRIDNSFGLDHAEADENGEIYLEGGCDWLHLELYDVATNPALPTT